MSEKKNQKRMMDKVRSGYANPSSIKVVYLGLRYGGFYYGTVIEAKACHAVKGNLPYPYPKYMHCDYKIIDEDGDTYGVSGNGIDFVKDWYPVSDDIEVGTQL
ncbi:hypothetical protein [Enterococcus wangshanyuanii]|uniref:Uncharacterized protein n=2 Tax=Enterococcus wangshanyuanii TaxID=2005703 RepID=A0ABQ1NEQ6_9ENTE|nr:hypothetical protein [Enterococcus wangshanyuanii]GGC74792.1 hypothetical protein GCM10011573_00400 [Enterococcus wangshanyuanii]